MIPKNNFLPKKKNPMEDAIKRRMAAKQTAVKNSTETTSPNTTSPEDEITKRRKAVGY